MDNLVSQRRKGEDVLHGLPHIFPLKDHPTDGLLPNKIAFIFVVSKHLS